MILRSQLFLQAKTDVSFLRFIFVFLKSSLASNLHGSYQYNIFLNHISPITTMLSPEIVQLVENWKLRVEDFHKKFKPQKSVPKPFQILKKSSYVSRSVNV